jgi:phage protein D
MDSQRIAYLQVWLDGEAMADAEGRVLRVEVEERADDVSSFHMSLDLAPGDGEWNLLADGRFALLHRVTIGFGLGPPDSATSVNKTVVFDGYITAVEPHFGSQRVPDSTLELYGLDASCLMHLEERTRRWPGQADSDIVKSVFGEYGFRVDDANIETTTTRTEDRSVIMQRGTDAELVRMLARRNGFEAFIEPVGTAPSEGGAAASACVAHFHRARPDGAKQPPLTMTPHAAPTVIEMTARWESHRPATIRAQHIDEQTRRIRIDDQTKPRWERLGKVGRAEILKERLAAVLPKRPATVALGLQHADVPHDPAEVATLGWADFVGTNWLVEARAKVRAVSYPEILRARRPIELKGAGKLLDGTWYVKTARHTWAWDDEENQYEVELDLCRDGLNGVA